MKKNKIISILMSLVLVIGVTVGVIGAKPAEATCPSGIMNNGLNGIYININAAPYTTLASSTSVAYQRGGCAWFASSRARQLTGKSIIIHSPSNWWNTYYRTYGFSRGSYPSAKCLAIFPNHMLVVERVDGSTLTVSEGATPRSDANHGYCIIRTVSRSTLESSYGGLVGYVYLGVGQGSNTGSSTSTSTPAKTYTKGYYRTNTDGSNLNVRSGAGQGYSVVAKIPDGTQVYVSQVSGSWGKVTYGGVSGWISLDWCTK